MTLNIFYGVLDRGVRILIIYVIFTLFDTRKWVQGTAESHAGHQHSFFGVLFCATVQRRPIAGSHRHDAAPLTPSRPRRQAALRPPAPNPLPRARRPAAASATKPLAAVILLLQRPPAASPAFP